VVEVNDVLGMLTHPERSDYRGLLQFLHCGFAGRIPIGISYVWPLFFHLGHEELLLTLYRAGGQYHWVAGKLPPLICRFLLIQVTVSMFGPLPPP